MNALPLPAAVIFDLDGVLFLSTPVHDEAFRKTFASVGIASFDYPRFAGMRTKKTIEAVLQEHGLHLSQAEIERLARFKTDLAYSELRLRKPVAPQCREVLCGLREHCRLGLGSSASKRNVDLFFELSGCRPFFSCVLDGSSVREAKPSPEIYLSCCAHLGVEPADCVIVEDAILGVQAAKAAGAVTCAIASTVSARELYGCGADTVIDSLEQLPAVFQIHESSWNRRTRTVV
jgi:beta-phosphoglucomutase